MQITQAKGLIRGVQSIFNERGKCFFYASVARMVRQGTANPYYAGSSPVRCSIINFYATLAQLVEHLTCNEDVVSSTLTGGSILIIGIQRSLASAFALGAKGRRFESCYPDHMSTSSSQVRTPGFHPGNRSSNLRVDAIFLLYSYIYIFVWKQHN